MTDRNNFKANKDTKFEAFDKVNGKVLVPLDSIRDVGPDSIWQLAIQTGPNNVSATLIWQREGSDFTPSINTTLNAIEFSTNYVAVYLRSSTTGSLSSIIPAAGGITSYIIGGAALNVDTVLFIKVN